MSKLSKSFWIFLSIFLLALLTVVTIHEGLFEVIEEWLSAIHPGIGQGFIYLVIIVSGAFAFGIAFITIYAFYNQFRIWFNNKR